MLIINMLNFFADKLIFFAISFIWSWFLLILFGVDFYYLIFIMSWFILIFIDFYFDLH